MSNTNKRRGKRIDIVSKMEWPAFGAVQFQWGRDMAAAVIRWFRRLQKHGNKQNELQLNREHYSRLSKRLDGHRESFESLASDLGYRWPDDTDRQCELLIILAKRAAYWKSAVASEQLAVMRESRYVRLSQRCGYLAKRLRNCQKALAQFKTAQFAALREMEVDLINRGNDIARREKELAAQIAENAALPEKSEKV